MKKIMLAITVCLMSFLLSIPVFAAVDSTNDSFSNAKSISLNSTYSGELSKDSTKDYYKFTISESGRVNVKVTTTMGYTYYHIYDSSNTKVWGSSYSNGTDKNVDLVAGTYYFYVGKDDYNGSYSFKLTFTSANESKSESVGSTLNSLDAAPTISLDTEYKGQLAYNDSKDYYKFTLAESGKVNLEVTTTMGYTYYHIYNSSNVKVWGSSYSNGVNKDVHLLAGTYYFYVGEDDYIGNYSFKLSYTSAKESFGESVDQTLNSIDSAPSISTGIDYSGQLAHNDSKDYFKFTLDESGCVNVKVITTMGYTYYHIYDSSNVKVWGSSYSNGVDKNVHLLAGTYYFYVGEDDYIGNYNFNLTFTPANESVDESVGSTMNSLDTAPGISLGQSYNGQLACNDSKDYYKFSISSPTKLFVNVKTDMGYTYYHIYNSSNSKVWGSSYSNGVDKSVDLEAGTYYFYVGEDDYNGNYSFSLSPEHDCSGPWINTLEPTCTETGKKEQICSVCGKTIEVQTIPANGHVSSNWTISREATCDADGLRHGVCSVCNENVTESIPQLTHVFGNWEVLSGSKLIPPIVKEKQCSLCGEVEQVKDWSFVWVPIVCGVVALFAVIGIINYVRILKKGKTK